ncbi:LOW QUALITY PROTEIN: uncharacterized protein LOC128259800 [Drosophila gunungcola]|uniref:LOW QUALITY PROTEIN: uncharacterized protein LOC128259800 n=1 Tax=Drosophila gunungcola TaxID=103775 RepID=UPI0022E416C8|nr:LOW QUALITY PROTEIN: uncharacterized protein LOC128259800 [Drosophila gunungcola]
MQRPVWACTIKVSVAAMSEDPAAHPTLSFTSRIPLSLSPGKATLYVHTSNAMYYTDSDLFCLPKKPKVKRIIIQRGTNKIFTKILRQLFNEHEESEGGIYFVMDI